jgi:hypothetical protein
MPHEPPQHPLDGEGSAQCSGAALRTAIPAPPVIKRSARSPHSGHFFRVPADIFSSRWNS